ncbi:MAG: hypothetical protein CM15mP102_04030 [Flavobacteriales bacterium]|nr:MAG: hypothetical protein CM15mP102_04030 [Flavobacteriales bacterium]
MNFHGIEKEFSISARVTQLNEITLLSGEFIVSLTDFLVERPSLLTRKLMTKSIWNLIYISNRLKLMKTSDTNSRTVGSDSRQ